MLTHNTAAVFFVLALNIPVLGLMLVRRSGKHVDIRAINAQRFPRNWLKIQGVALLVWSIWLVPFVIQSLRVDGERHETTDDNPPRPREPCDDFYHS